MVLRPARGCPAARTAAHRLDLVRTALALLLACVVVLHVVPDGHAKPLGCHLPDAHPLWIDFADGSVKFAEAAFGRPGVVAATRGAEPGAALRRRGAQTVHWHMELPEIVGNLRAPHARARVKRATRTLIRNARATTRCRTPVIVLNELFGASIPTPWPRNVARYRANVLVTMRLLSASGARPFLLVHGRARGARAPNTAGRAASWWRAVARQGFIVRQMHFDGPRFHRLGVRAASRARRIAMRQAISAFTRIDIPAARIGLLLGFQSGRGKGGREGLGRQAWFQTVKRETLAARQVASELGIRAIFSWGWGTFNAAGADPDKRVAACIHLWTRDASLCDAPAAAGPAFDASRSKGQIALAAGAYCASNVGNIARRDVTELARLLGSRKRAVSALFMQLVAVRHREKLRWGDVRRIERTIVATRFAGNRGAYERALRGRGIGRKLARSILTNAVQRETIRVRATILDPHRKRGLTLRRRYRDARASAVCARDNIPSHGVFNWAREVPLLTLPRRSLTISARRERGSKPKIRLSGRLTNGRGTITLYAGRTPLGPYAKVATTHTNSAGEWRFAVTPTERASYRVLSLTAVSPPVTVQPAPSGAASS